MREMRGDSPSQNPMVSSRQCWRFHRSHSISAGAPAFLNLICNWDFLSAGAIPVTAGTLVESQKFG